MKSDHAQAPLGSSVDTTFAFQLGPQPPSVALAATSASLVPLQEKHTPRPSLPGFGVTRAIIGCWPRCYRVTARKVRLHLLSPLVMDETTK